MKNSKIETKMWNYSIKKKLNKTRRNKKQITNSSPKQFYKNIPGIEWFRGRFLLIYCYFYWYDLLIADLSGKKMRSKLFNVSHPIGKRHSTNKNETVVLKYRSCSRIASSSMSMRILIVNIKNSLQNTEADTRGVL